MTSWTDERRHDLADLFATVSAQLGRLATSAEEAVSDHTKDRLLRASDLARREAAGFMRKPRFGVVGMFNTGKSLVVNTLLDRDVAHVGFRETTPVAADIEFAGAEENEEAEILYTDGRRERLSVSDAIEFTNIRSAVYGDDETREERRRSIHRVYLRLRPALEMGFMSSFILADLPGFGAASEVGYAKAEEALSEVDLAVFVLDPTRYGHADEVRIARSVQARGRPLLLLLNKTDTADGARIEESELRRAEAGIRELFPMAVRGPSGEVLVFRYSAKKVREAQRRMANPELSANERQDTVAELATWGLLPRQDDTSGGPTAEGFLFYASRRWFSDESEEVRSRIASVSAAVISHIEDAEGAAIDEIASRTEERDKRRTSRTEKAGDCDRKIMETTEATMRECTEMFATEFAKLAQRIEDSFIAITSEYISYDLRLAARPFQDQEGLVEHLKIELEGSGIEALAREIEGNVEAKTKTIFRKNWGYLANETDVVAPALTGSGSAIVESLTHSVRSAVLAMAGILVTHVVVLGVLMAILPPLGFFLWGLASFLGGIPIGQGEKSRRLRHLRSRARTELKAKEAELKMEYLGQLAALNVGVAANFRATILGREDDERIAQLTKEVAELRTVCAGLRELNSVVRSVTEPVADS